MINENSKRTICEALRELYRKALKSTDGETLTDIEGLIKYAYLSAKRMDKKLKWYKNGRKTLNPEHGKWKEENWLNQLEEVKKEPR